MERISIDPAICHGKPTVRGLRYPVEIILELLSSGMTYEEVLADYEDLEREDILAVLAYAARLCQVKRIEADFWLGASSPSLNEVWDNAEDDRYAELLEACGHRTIQRQKQILTG